MFGREYSPLPRLSQNVLLFTYNRAATDYWNAKLERMFKAIGRVKTDWRNQMGRDRLEPGLRISEEGMS